MAKIKNNPGCNASGACGCATCDIGSDDFNRSDDTNLGSAWTEESGSWAVSSNQLVCSSAGTIKFNTPHPDGFTTTIAQVEFSHTTSGSSIDVIVARVDSSNYYYARYVVGSNQIQIRRCNAGTHSTLGSTSITINTGTTYTAKVCCSATVIHAYLNGTVRLTVDNLSTAGTYTGLSANGSGTATFDNWLVKKNWKQGSAESCDKCSNLVSCGISGCAPGYWQVVVDSGTYAGTYLVYPDAEFRSGSGPPGSGAFCYWISHQGSACPATIIASVYTDQGGLSRFTLENNAFSPSGVSWAKTSGASCVDGAVLTAEGPYGTCSSNAGSTATIYKGP